MLRLSTSTTGRFCDNRARRDFLRVGALGLAGWALSDVLRVQASAAGRGQSYVKDKAVVLLFLSGGPSQLETFDPKPDGKGTSTSIAGHIPTRISGVRFASYFPQLAELADRLTVVRSFHTQHAEHNAAHKQILTSDLTVQDGKPIRQPGIGSIFGRIAGAVNEATGLPTQAVIPPTTNHLAQRAGFNGSYESVVEGLQPAWLGSSLAPLECYAPMAEGVAKPRAKRSQGKKQNESSATQPFIDDLQPRVEDLVIDGRRDLLEELDTLGRRLDADPDMDRLDAFTQQAVDLLRGGAMRDALDLNREDPRIVAAYDTEHFRNYRCNDDSKFEREGPSTGISLGRQLLLARRLCEAGSRFVTVIHANWDFHARKGIPNMPEGMSVLAPPLDHAVAAFLRDVEQRGLSEKILLVITGEFGRTPTLDENLGRHHWPGVCPLVFAGGGLRHGQVVGQSDARGGEPANDPISIADFQSTMLHALVDVGRMRLDSSLPRPVLARAEGGRPIAALWQ